MYAIITREIPYGVYDEIGEAISYIMDNRMWVSWIREVTEEEVSKIKIQSKCGPLLYENSIDYILSHYDHNVPYIDHYVIKFPSLNSLAYSYPTLSRYISYDEKYAIIMSDMVEGSSLEGYDWGQHIDLFASLWEDIEYTIGSMGWKDVTHGDKKVKGYRWMGYEAAEPLFPLVYKHASGLFTDTTLLTTPHNEVLQLSIGDWVIKNEETGVYTTAKHSSLV